mmetsp:Transcript_6324/g.12505  ORF Transcript_6324/g.12505 Transcript_6324/m.12505 type:complete len:1208 (-) Transcript_6324:266-3889(-)
MIGLFGEKDTPMIEHNEADHKPSPTTIFSDGDDDGEGIEQSYSDHDCLEFEYEQMIKKHMDDEEGDSEDRESQWENENSDRGDDNEAENIKDNLVEIVKNEGRTMIDDEGNDDFNLPSYHIRRSIATKVIAKKVSRGYILLDDPCDGCGMPLMELNGKVECKVCPAIAKWIRRQKSRQLCCEVEVRDAQESDERGVEETQRRDENHVENVFDGNYEDPLNASVNTDGVNVAAAYLAQSPRSSETNASCEPTGDLPSSYDPEYLEEEQNPDAAAVTEGYEAHEYDIQPTCLRTSQSIESYDDLQDKIIEERAKQIIMDARRNQGWSFDSSHSNEQSQMKHHYSNDADDNAINEVERSIDSNLVGYQDEKSTDVIHVTREKLSISVSSESKNSCSLQIGGDIVEDFQNSFESNYSKSLKKIEMRAESIIMESRKKLQLGNDIGAAVDMILSPRSMVRRKQRDWLVWTKSRLSSWDAAIVLQAIARRFLARKLYLDMKASVAYQTLVVGRVEDTYQEDRTNLLTETFCCRSDEELESNGQNEVSGDSVKLPGNNSANECDDRQQNRPPSGLLCFSSHANLDINENEVSSVSAKLPGNKCADGCNNLSDTEDRHRLRNLDVVRNAQKDLVEEPVGHLKEDRTVDHVIEAKSEEENDVSASDVISKYDSRDPPASATDIIDSGLHEGEQVTEPVKYMELNYRNPPAAQSEDDDDEVTSNDKYFMESPKGACFDFAENKKCTDPFNEMAKHQAPYTDKSDGVCNRDIDTCQFPDPTPFSQDYFAATHRGRDEIYHIKPDPPVINEIPRCGTAVPKRNVLADVACKFDDAVSKVVKNMTSLVTCTTNAEAFERAIDIDHLQSSSGEREAVATISMRHEKIVMAESRRKMASTQIMYRLKSGWRLANASCPACQMPTMIRPGGDEKVCVVCSDAGLEGNSSMTVPSTDDCVVSTLTRSTFSNNTSYEQSRQISGEISRRLNSGWLVLAAVCPACKIPLMKSPVDNLDHCLSCGPVPSRFSTFQLSSNSSSSRNIMECNKPLTCVGDCNEFGINDRERRSEYTGQPAFVNNYYMHQHLNTPNFHDEPNTFMHQTQRGREPPNPHKPLRNCYYNVSAPHCKEPVHGDLTNMREDQEYEMKENSHSDANFAGRQQMASAAALSAIEEAKMRIENARRHISTSKALRVPRETRNINIYGNSGTASTVGRSGNCFHHSYE